MALQSRINAGLAEDVGGGVVAATISFGVGLLVALVITVMSKQIRVGLSRIPKALGARTLRPWQLLGGMGGAWLVTTQGLTVAVVGVTAFIVAVVAGQVAGSLVVDRLGLSPVGTLPISLQRGGAALIALIAVAISGWGTFLVGGSGALVAVALAASAGVGISIQQAINARVSAAAEGAMPAAVVNFVVGFTVLLLAVLIGILIGIVEISTFPANPWLYLGGPIGLAFIALAAWAVRGLGVLLFGLLSIAGQLAGGLTLDLLFPSADLTLGLPAWLGLFLIIIAVWLAGRGSRQVSGGTMAE